MSAAWSPDGKQMAYFNGSRNGVFAIDLDGSHDRVLGPGFIPLWSPDGKQIALLPHRVEPVLSVVYADGGGLVRLSDDAGTATWSPDSRRMAFTNSALSELFLINPDGTGLQSLFHDPSAEINDLLWPPDGGQIYIVQTNRDDSLVSIDLVNVDGSGTSELVALSDKVYGTQISPDGKWAAFISAGSIEIMKTDGADRRILVQQQLIGDLVWSPDGSRIAFTSKTQQDMDIYVVNVDGSGLVNVTNHPGFNDTRLTWSVDGSRLAFDVNEVSGDGINTETDIYIVDVPGS